MQRPPLLLFVVTATTTHRQLSGLRPNHTLLISKMIRTTDTLWSIKTDRGNGEVGTQLSAICEGSLAGILTISVGTDSDRTRPMLLPPLEMV